ncbi:sarcosine oxidase subunit delta [Thalassorhabdomicrobium marinisediminis]|uniref:Sarcosine oxidase subunit delta n=1 Tax=Thalassorhabdomicrobium marinisediminis TaxID=2170577 RepID=A0A2T7G178_9RHOB|nr:sarcosine oxidase subunit delta [Thalassorhabdomicrobium marinisediminis]PVA08171.1 sarcosine oxidase subunit delta [Thalassorhabdomicrobium marinisediminis]
MLTLSCPYCGVQCDETELAAGGEAHLKRYGPESSPEEFESYLFVRENPKGVHLERWRHAHGCGKWFHAARCTMTLEVFGTYPAQTLAPPQELVEKILAKRPGWTWREFGQSDMEGAQA